MAEPNTARKTIDQEFTERQYNQSGVFNTKVYTASNDNYQKAANDNNARVTTAPVSTPQRRVKQPRKKPRSPVKKALGFFTKTRALLISPWIWGFCGLLYVFQIIFWIVFVLGMALEEVSLGILPGQNTAEIGYYGAVFMGIFSLLFASAIYIFFGLVNPFKGRAGGLFVVALIGYLTPFLNLFPWGILWSLAVIYEAGHVKSTHKKL